LGSGLLVGFPFQFLFEIDDFQARAHAAPRRPGGGRGVVTRSPINFYLKLTIFLAGAWGGEGGARARAHAPARENINLKKKLKGKTSHGSW
jgi:hypothetical protein